ncbi:UDP-N-acetylglucosamine--dolichyl-phosphate N-acetylglucosaminephosphotransferase [Candidatus Bipolaricaulota sp. J31]
MLGLVALVAFGTAFLGTMILIPRLKRAGIVGADVHKPGRPEVPEMGGLALVAGFGTGVLLAISLATFWERFPSLDVVALLAVLCTVLLTTLLGVTDDLIGIRQWVKALLPVVAALPLVVVRLGASTLRIPFIGLVDFGPFYALVLVPLGVTGAANAVNMLAGFNGLELGMGLVALGSLATIAASAKAITSLALLLAGIGALLGVLYFNWYPARVFVGDVGTLSIGAIIAASVIVGNFEWAGLIVIIPYALDFLFKAAHGFPSKGWWGELGEDGKLYCPPEGPVGLGQFILRIAGGLHERTLVLVLIGLEALCGLAAVLLYRLL